MKKLALLMLAILMLGCETETPVVKETLSIIEAPSPIAASGEHLRLDIVGPHIEGADIADGANKEIRERMVPNRNSNQTVGFTRSPFGLTVNLPHKMNPNFVSNQCISKTSGVTKHKADCINF